VSGGGAGEEGGATALGTAARGCVGGLGGGPAGVVSWLCEMTIMPLNE